MELSSVGDISLYTLKAHLGGSHLLLKVGSAHAH